MKNKKRILKRIFVVCIVFVILGSIFYIQDGYSMDATAKSALHSTAAVIVKEERSATLFQPNKKTNTGLIFYPGGKVEYQAYAPLMQDFAKKGIYCVLVKMPLNLAVFDVNAADSYIQTTKNITNWYIGGHSLGGAMAAKYADQHPKNLKGPLLLGAYSTQDLTDTNLSCLAIYGSHDHIMNHDHWHKYRHDLPENTVVKIIKGGNHSQFGSYGLQNKDGKATISPAKQQHETVEEAIKLMHIVN